MRRQFGGLQGCEGVGHLPVGGRLRGGERIDGAESIPFILASAQHLLAGGDAAAALAPYQACRRQWGGGLRIRRSGGGGGASAPLPRPRRQCSCSPKPNPVSKQEANVCRSRLCAGFRDPSISTWAGQQQEDEGTAHNRNLGRHLGSPAAPQTLNTRVFERRGWQACTCEGAAAFFPPRATFL